MAKQKVVVLGYGFSSRMGIARALGKAGYNVSVIVIEGVRTRPIDCFSKYVSHYYYCNGNREDRLLKILLENCVEDGQKVILIPINDFTATVLDKNYNILKEHFHLPHIKGEQGAITGWMNKEKQKELARRVGLNVANSIDIEIENGVFHIPSNISYPCFTKTRTFTSGYKQTLQKCEDEDALYNFVKFLSSKHESLTLMVEDYMEIESEYAVVGFANKNEVTIPGVIEIVKMADGNDKGIALQGKVMPCSGFEDLLKMFKEFMKSIGFVGMFDIDFYLCRGKYYFGELNLRIGGSGTAVISQGINLPEMFVRTVLGEPITGMKDEVLETKTYVNERICIENWYYRYLTSEQLYTLLRTSEISFVKDKSDRLPEVFFYLDLGIMFAKRLLKRIMNPL